MGGLWVCLGTFWDNTAVLPSGQDDCLCQNEDTKCILMSTLQMVSYFFQELPLKATVHFKIETIPPLGCGLEITSVLYGIFTIHF